MLLWTSRTRREGPGPDENVVEGNYVDNNALAGISIHSWVCNPEPGEPRPGLPNERTLRRNSSCPRRAMARQ